MALSSRQRAFIEQYLRCWNGAEAARCAGYAEKSAAQQASRLLTIDKVQQAIAARLAELKMGADEVLVRLSEQARASMADFVSPDTDSISLIKAEAAGKLHLIKKFTHTVSEKSENTSIELYDAQAALVQLGRAHGLFLDRTDVRVDELPILILDK